MPVLGRHRRSSLINCHGFRFRFRSGVRSGRSLVSGSMGFGSHRYVRQDEQLVPQLALGSRFRFFFDLTWFGLLMRDAMNLSSLHRRRSMACGQWVVGEDGTCTKQSRAKQSRASRVESMHIHTLLTHPPQSALPDRLYVTRVGSMLGYDIAIPYDSGTWTQAGLFLI